MKRVQLFSHVGWFGICPVFAAEIDSEEPHITPRMDNLVFEGLFLASHWAFMAFFLVVDFLFPTWQPGFPIFITGRLLVPHRYEYDDEDEK